MQHIIGHNSSNASETPSSKKNDARKATNQIKSKSRQSEQQVRKNIMKNRDKLKTRSRKYVRGKLLSKDLNVKDKRVLHNIKRTKKQGNRAALAAAKAEILLTETPGYLEAEGVERTFNFSQHSIAKAVDEASSKKIFTLKLEQFGPYTTRYTANGRHLVLGGRKGHVAAFDWQTGHLSFEINVGETVRDVQWLHNGSMLAVAQRRHVYLYNNQGTEINFLEKHIDPLKLDFLRYHFLLVSIGNAGFLKYHDVSVGKLVADLPTRLGSCNVMRQNPFNAVMHLGHKNGTVTLWSPTVREPLVKQLCHHSPIEALAVNTTGNVMATAGTDGVLKIWDIRHFKDAPLHSYFTPTVANYLDFSQRDCLAVAHGPHVQIWQTPHRVHQKSPYLCHLVPSSPIKDCHFCPFEDVLALGHHNGIDSILVPGSGEPNFDAYEANPYETKKQRREHEVKQLLDKIPYDLIQLNPRSILQPAAPKLEKGGDSTPAKEKEDEDDTIFTNIHKSRRAKKNQRRFLSKHKNIRDERREKLLAQIKANKARKEAAKQENTNRSALDRFIKV